MDVCKCGIQRCIVYTSEFTESLQMSQRIVLQLEQFINFLQIQSYVNRKKLFFYMILIMYRLNKHVIPYRLTYSTSICQILNNDKMTSPRCYSISYAYMVDIMSPDHLQTLKLGIMVYYSLYLQLLT